MNSNIRVVGFDGDDTLWHSQPFYDDAQARFEAIMGRYLDVTDEAVRAHVLATEKRNLALFGYGAKGMTLSMLEAAIELTERRISATDLGTILEMGREVLRHPVELLDGIREAVEAVATRYRIVLITKGDLQHQELKVRQCGLADLFHRIEIVSEKDVRTYERVIGELAIAPNEFAMVGNSLRSDIEPVVRVGGYGVHLPYHTTWAHELEHSLEDPSHYRTIAHPRELADALATL